MSDIVNGGASGGVVAGLILGLNWAKSLIGKNGNGSSSQSIAAKFITRDEYEARHRDIMNSLSRIETKVDHIRL
jgi:hypothetical protein